MECIDLTNLPFMPMPSGSPWTPCALWYRFLKSPLIPNRSKEASGITRGKIGVRIGYWISMWGAIHSNHGDHFAEYTPPLVVQSNLNKREDCFLFMIVASIVCMSSKFFIIMCYYNCRIYSFRIFVPVCNRSWLFFRVVVCIQKDQRTDV
jgi:hypothetical protein